MPILLYYQQKPIFRYSSKTTSPRASTRPNRQSSGAFCIKNTPAMREMGLFGPWEAQKRLLETEKTLPCWNSVTRVKYIPNAPQQDFPTPQRQTKHTPLPGCVPFGSWPAAVAFKAIFLTREPFWRSHASKKAQCAARVRVL